MKDITMKKNNFINGALITTMGIIFTKILGVVYVIPFHKLIGDEGGALYSYAYTFYLFFMSLASAGIPLSITKLVSEYQALGYYNIKERVFSLGKMISIIFGLSFFIIMILFAPILSKLILGDISGKINTSDVCFVIRVISCALLIVPLLSVYRAYFEGHRLFSPPSISQVIEQAVRVLIIIIGSFLSLYFFHIPVRDAVAVSLMGAVCGAVVSYIYLIIKMRRNIKKFKSRARKVNEPLISNKILIKKIVFFSIPFICIDFFKSMYNYIDMFTVARGLISQANFSVDDAETIFAMISTWANKFNILILSISSGVVVSLLPNLEENVVKNKKTSIEKNIGQALNIIFYLILPITIGISFLSKPIWTLFYGESLYGPILLSYYIFVGLFVSLFVISSTILQSLNDYKGVFICLISGVVVKLLCNTKFIRVFYLMKLPAYYGVITASILGYLVSFIIFVIILKCKYNINFENIIHNFIDIVCGCIIMIVVLFILRLLLVEYSNNFIINMLLIMIYGLVGFFIYFIYTYKVGIFKRIFGNFKMFKFSKKM